MYEPGAHPPVEFIPIFKYVPARWVSWKALCSEIRELQFKLYGGLIDLSLVEGEADTTALFLQSLTLWLVAHPEVQLKAQEEIDSVIGSDRAPVLEDFQSLPYVQAIIKDTLRFRPIVPLGVPHYTSGDEKVDGFCIPKGCTTFIDQWAMFHDSDFYDDPEVLRPEQFLAAEPGNKLGADLTGRNNDLHFGGGRRICVGMHLANNTFVRVLDDASHLTHEFVLILTTMNLLWAFKLKEAIGPLTKDLIPVDINDYSTKSETHANLIQRKFAAARLVFEQFEHDLSEEDEDCDCIAPPDRSQIRGQANGYVTGGQSRYDSFPESILQWHAQYTMRSHPHPGIQILAMVRISSAIVVFPFVLAALASPLSKRTAAQVEYDISNIDNQVNVLNTAIEAFPDSGGSLVDALAIHTGATYLETAINSATSDTQARYLHDLTLHSSSLIDVQATNPFSDADGQTILSQLRALGSDIISALQHLVTKKSAFEASPISDIPTLEQDLRTLESDTSAFEDAIIANTPADLLDQANSIKSDVDSALTKAVAAYAS
ncbi:hypothetical protein EW146_g5883 [Bondarzewia mesenterica]|uniref:Cytochrome P450 n=1 Tax=Bondarzewia mesenterica TaxID=1095465 RepID=A0A4S4LQS8_9AGAM|nr:hypothetical protein EW146_g5883 [Bondarzewia mesenterica]